MTRKNRRLPRISKARLEEMIEQATVDAYNESEQITGWFTMIDENLAVPFETTVLGVPVTVERLDLNHSEQIVAVCTRGRIRPGRGQRADQLVERQHAFADCLCLWRWSCRKNYGPERQRHSHPLRSDRGCHDRHLD